MSRLAIVSLQRQIHVMEPDGRVRALTAPLPRVPGSSPWSMLQRNQDAWSWPTWSPDGQQIAAFAVEAGDDRSGPARVVVLSLDGVRQTELAELDGGAPIYLQWHPQGKALTVLLQQGEDLSLALLRHDRLGNVRPLEQGVPLFFNWTPDGARLLIHVGVRGADEGRLVFRDPLGTEADELLDRPPGTFCAPVGVAGRAVYALRDQEGGSEIVVSDLAGHNLNPLLHRRGLVAIVPAPAGLPLVAVSHAPRGEGTPYRGLDVVNVETGAVRNVRKQDGLAFAWSPDGRWLLHAVVESEQNCLRWYRVPVEGGEAEPLASFWPTRDTLFFLHFFDQYAISHPVLSADGRFLAFAGYPAGGGQADLSQSPRVWIHDIEGRRTESLSDGSFCTWAPVEDERDYS